MPAKKRLTVTLTGPFAERLSRLVDEGLYIDNQDAIRDALRRLFKAHGMEIKRDSVPREPV